MKYTKRAINLVLCLFPLTAVNSNLIGQSQACSDVGFNPPLVSVSDVENCFTPGIGTIKRGRAWSITAIKLPSLQVYDSGWLSYRGEGACIGGVGVVPLKCEPQAGLPVDISSSTSHVMQVTVENRTIRKVGGQIVPLCLHAGLGKFRSLPMPRNPCPEEAGCQEPSGGCGNGFWDEEACECVGDETPILIAAQVEGLSLSSVEGGVLFDLNADGIAEPTAWTTPQAQASFLVMDRNGNGSIDDGRELFGNYTPQPFSRQPNGFKALALFDHPEYGGNDDQRISPSDRVFDRLSLWKDRNHDGQSQQGEIRSLEAAGILAINLRYGESGHLDEHGNRLRLVSKVLAQEKGRGPVRRFAVDVFFATR